MFKSLQSKRSKGETSIPPLMHKSKHECINDKVEIGLRQQTQWLGVPRARDNHMLWQWLHVTCDSPKDNMFLCMQNVGIHLSQPLTSSYLDWIFRI